MSIQITPLHEEHLEDAAALVSTRYKALREWLPVLPPRFEQEETVLSKLQGLISEANGAVALHGTRLVGFMLGFVIPMFQGKRSVYSPEWANAAEMGESRRIYEEMYRYLSARWIDDECFTHLVSILSNDREGIEGWQWLGFGFAAVDGVRELKPVDPGGAQVEIRRASVQDVEEVVKFGKALERHLAEAPTFWIHELQDHEEWLKESQNALWLAYAREEAVGYMRLESDPEGVCEVVLDEGTVSITGAFTREKTRGRGIATALLNRSLEWARHEGYERCAVDFEPMNVLATRFWMRWFDPVCYSLMRCIDERLSTYSPKPS